MMKAWEFESAMTQEGQIALPRELASELPIGEQLRIVVMWAPSSDDAAWQKAGRRSFEAAYSPEDNIFDRLMDDPATR